MTVMTCVERMYLRRPFAKFVDSILLRVGTWWRCGDGLFFEVPPLASDALLTKLHPLLENVLQTVDHFEISCLGAPFSWLEKPRNRMGARSGLYGGCSNGVPPIHFSQAEHRIRFRSCPMRFLGISNHENHVNSMSWSSGLWRHVGMW
jgi:hypothetical protein